MRNRPERHARSSPGAALPSIETPDPYGPLLVEIRAAVGELRDRLESGLADLRDRVESRTKAHFRVEEIAALTARAPYTVGTGIKEGRSAAIRIPGTGPKGRRLVPRQELEKLIECRLGAGVPAVAIGAPGRVSELEPSVAKGHKYVRRELP